MFTPVSEREQCVTSSGKYIDLACLLHFRNRTFLPRDRDTRNRKNKSQDRPKPIWLVGPVSTSFFIDIKRLRILLFQLDRMPVHGWYQFVLSLTLHVESKNDLFSVVVGRF